MTDSQPHSQPQPQNVEESIEETRRRCAIEAITPKQWSNLFKNIPGENLKTPWWRSLDDAFRAGAQTTNVVLMCLHKHSLTVRFYGHSNEEPIVDILYADQIISTGHSFNPECALCEAVLELRKLLDRKMDELQRGIAPLDFGHYTAAQCLAALNLIGLANADGPTAQLLRNRLASLPKLATTSDPDKGIHYVSVDQGETYKPLSMIHGSRIVKLSTGSIHMDNVSAEYFDAVTMNDRKWQSFDGVDWKELVTDTVSPVKD